MNIKDIMTPNPAVINPQETLTEAARRMKDLNVGSLPVCDGDRLRGMITDRDIAIRATAEGRDPSTTQVEDVMSHKVVYCFEDDQIREAARLMQENQIRRLPILNREKRLVGIVSLGDLSVDAGMDQLSGETLSDISKPSRPVR